MGQRQGFFGAGSMACSNAVIIESKLLSLTSTAGNIIKFINNIKSHFYICNLNGVFRQKKGGRVIPPREATNDDVGLSLLQCHMSKYLGIIDHMTYHTVFIWLVTGIFNG